MDTADVGRAATTTSNTPLLQGLNLCVERGNKRLLDDISVEIGSNELVGLVGPNGAGKSTLLSVLAGLETPKHGEVKLQGRALKSFADNERAQKMGWLEQFSASHWPVSVEHLVTLGRLPYLSRWRSPDAEDLQKVEAAMAATDCLALRNQSVTTLSGGELTRVMVARVLASEPDILLADEPVAALDIGHQLQTMEQLKKFSSCGRGCLVVLHELSLAMRYCDRLYLLNESRLVATGTPPDVLTAGNIRDVYGVEIETKGGTTPHIIPLSRSTK